MKHVVELALILTLFSDGLLVERELLGRHWGPAARALVLAMPVTLVAARASRRVLFPPLTVAECFLLAAVLTPTDPVVTSTVVTAQRVPALVRHTLNLESGLNDGLALPLVLFFLTLAEPGGDAGARRSSCSARSRSGALIGLALAFVAGRALRAAARARASPATTRASTRSAWRWSPTGSPTRPSGNGLIAAFVAGVALRRRGARHPGGLQPVQRERERGASR